MTTSLTLISETTDLTTVQNKVVLTSIGVAVGPEGPQGAEGQQGIQGITGLTGLTGDQGTAGTDGLSAYEIAVAGGFDGTEAGWLLSLEGDQGIPGDTGLQGIQGLQGIAGIAGSGIDHVSLISTVGLVKTYEIWEDSLETVSLGTFTVTDGTAGVDGADGTDGVNGVDGTDGADGLTYDDTNVAKLNVDQTFINPFRSTIVSDNNTLDFTVARNFVVTATADLMDTPTIDANCTGQDGTITIHSAENITGWDALYKFKTIPTDLTGTERFGYFIESATSIAIGRVQ